jgi:hypothetical protein
MGQLITKCNALRRQIDKWREIQDVYMLSIAKCRVESMPPNDASPETIPLHLPSALPADIILPFLLILLTLKHVYGSRRRMTVSMTSRGFFESQWACGITSTQTSDLANGLAPICTPSLVLFRRKSFDVWIATVLLATHFLSWTPVGLGLSVFRN